MPTDFLLSLIIWQQPKNSPVCWRWFFSYYNYFWSVPDVESSSDWVWNRIGEFCIKYEADWEIIAHWYEALKIIESASPALKIEAQFCHEGIICLLSRKASISDDALSYNVKEFYHAKITYVDMHDPMKQRETQITLASIWKQFILNASLPRGFTGLVGHGEPYEPSIVHLQSW